MLVALGRQEDLSSRLAKSTERVLRTVRATQRNPLKKRVILKIFIWGVSICVGTIELCVEVRGQPKGSSSFLLPHRFWKLN